MIGEVALPGGPKIAQLGQGTWRMGEGHRSRAEEAAAIRLGIDFGMTLLDTAEMYAEGGAEEVVADAIAGQRDQVFVVSKVYPQNATRDGAAIACERSLRRLRTDRIDLYLLHWRGSVPLGETVEALAALQRAGKVRHWGVSNLDTDEMRELAGLADGAACSTDQILYNLEARGPELDLLPWCAGRAMPAMAYSPVGQGGRMLRHPALRTVGERHGATPAQVAIAWTLRLPHVVSIPKASDLAHVRENAAAAAITLTEADIGALDAAFPPPRSKRPLQML